MVNLQKSKVYQPRMEFVGMVVDRRGTRLAPSKIDAVTQLSKLTTVEEIWVFLGMRGFPGQFVSNYSILAAPISDPLRHPQFRSKRSRRTKVRWREEQTRAFRASQECLSSTPTLALPDLRAPFCLHTTDASETVSGAVLTQNRRAPGLEKAIANGNRR